jgi:hypothetical protein
MLRTYFNSEAVFTAEVHIPFQAAHFGFVVEKGNGTEVL